MHRGQSFVAVSLAFVLLGAAPSIAAEDAAPTARSGETLPSISLVGPDYPDYQERLGRLRLLGVPGPDALRETDAIYLRMSLVDVEGVEFLPPGLQVYQTVTTDLVLPVNLNFVVNQDKEGACFNPEIPYCADFDLLNTWLKNAHLTIEDKTQAGNLARFVVGLALSTVHHPEDFLFFRLTQDFGVQHYQYLRDIEDIYNPTQKPFRTEDRRAEYERVTSKYRDVVKPVRMEEVDDGFHMHAFTYKILRAAGDLREWNILVHRDGTVEVDLKTLETGVGELYWSWAP